MKLARFKARDASPRLGVVSDSGVYEIHKHLPDAPSTMAELLEQLETLRQRLSHLLTHDPDCALRDVQLLAPIERPGKILALGLNYRDHAAEAGMALPEHQTWFAKMATSANNPFDNIDLPHVSSKLDYEAELAFVIGRRVRHADKKQAGEAIAGYCIANDVSVRDWQLRTSQFTLGKSFDTHCPFGPWIVTADELKNPGQLKIRCVVNGELRQNSNTNQMVFNVLEMVEHLSQVMTLEPGDLILTGTPAGVGAVLKPPSYLREGDVVRVEIEGIGAIENRVVAETRVEGR